MSGGVDSSVAAYLLKEQGYHVIGATMQIWQQEDRCSIEKEGGCCGWSAVEDAGRVAHMLDIPYYVMNFRDDVSNVTIEEMELSYNTNIYAQDSSGEWVNIYEVTNESQRIPVNIDEIPQHTRDAFVCAEDERFYTHDGVDYKRTVSAFVNMFVHIYDTNQGGSTITQQLIKNITGDSEQSPSRKIREIFRAMELERAYSKDKILETYMNYIGFGGTSNGIEHAAQK